MCQGSLHDILRKKGRLDPQTAVSYALDIARFPSTATYTSVLESHSLIQQSLIEVESSQVVKLLLILQLF